MMNKFKKYNSYIYSTMLLPSENKCNHSVLELINDDFSIIKSNLDLVECTCKECNSVIICTKNDSRIINYDMKLLRK